MKTAITIVGTVTAAAYYASALEFINPNLAFIRTGFQYRDSQSVALATTPELQQEAREELKACQRPEIADALMTMLVDWEKAFRAISLSGTTQDPKTEEKVSLIGTVFDN